MAWRIDEAVVRGEIDNRERGRVAGTIWLAGRAEPLRLELEGDCWRDLAGRRLEFTNPRPKPVELAGLADRQRGTAGDITASRRVRVPEISLEEILRYEEEKRPFPWHWANSMYLEWFSERNGRVVIESADYELRVIGEPAWEQTVQQEAAQHERNAGAFTEFMYRLLGSTQPEKDGSNPGLEDEHDEKQ